MRGWFQDLPRIPKSENAPLSCSKGCGTANFLYPRVLYPRVLHPWIQPTRDQSKFGWDFSQWIGICLPIQGTQVRSLGQEDSTCHGAAKPVPTRCNYWAHAIQLLKRLCAVIEKAPQWEALAKSSSRALTPPPLPRPATRESSSQQRGPSAAKNEYIT